MCGIAGYFGSGDRGFLENAIGVIGHRGPDGHDLWADKQIGLAHVRLAIQDLSENGRQPMVSACGRYIITYNGEVYNGEDLKKNYLKAGSPLRGHSDTEILLECWVQHGHRYLKDLNGIFAFAILDRVEESLFLVRDGLGVKPLYLSEHSEGVVFSSELKAVLLHPKVDRSLDPIAVGDYLTYLYSPSSRTLLASVKKVTPGEVLEIKAGRVVRRESFYQLPFASVSSQPSFDEARVGVLDRLESAVESQLISDVPVGAFLSGGLDSSAIVACARKHLSKERLPCFTISHAKGSKDGFAEDLPYAMKVAKELDVDLNVLEIQPSMVENLDRMLWHLDEPLADPAAINVLLISELAKQNGVSVLLSGAGGDDLFTGYRRHYALQSEHYWSWLPMPFRSLLRKGSSLLPTGNPAMRRLSKAFAYADRSPLERMMGYFRWAPPNVISSLMKNQDCSQRDFCKSLLSRLEHYTGREEDELLKKMLFLEMSHFLVDHNLNYTDKLSMAVGVETRVPFLDTQLVEYACQLPISYKQVGREGKYVLKKAMEGILPNEVIYRPKTGFSAPLRTWLHGDMRDLLATVLSKQNVESRGIFHYDQIQKIIAMDRDSLADYSYVIFALVSIERWCQLFLDK